MKKFVAAILACLCLSSVAHADTFTVNLSSATPASCTVFMVVQPRTRPFYPGMISRELDNLPATPAPASFVSPYVHPAKYHTAVFTVINTNTGAILAPRFSLPVNGANRTVTVTYTGTGWRIN